jgi:uncharacterized protein YndB with AHSA1/START domain
MSSPLYSVERAYPVTIDALWTAWVDADALEQWYSPTALRVLPGSVVSDARVDGWWTVGVDVAEFGFVAYFYGTYFEVVPNSRLVHSLYYTQDATEFAARDLTLEHHIIEIDFENRGDTAWVRFAQFGDLAAEEAAGAQAGMESYFDNLGLFLTRT